MLLAASDVQIDVAKFGDIAGMQITVGQVAGCIVGVVVTGTEGRRADQQFTVDQLGFDTIEQGACRPDTPLRR
ncbi:hypothetical protein D3C79_707750 [compost metagenome]